METDELHEAFLACLADKSQRWTQAKIAKIIDCEPDSLYQYKSKKTLGDDKLLALAEFLEQKGYLSKGGDVVSDSILLLQTTLSLVKDPAKTRNQKARLLFNLLDIVSSEFGKELGELGANRDES